MLKYLFLIGDSEIQEQFGFCSIPETIELLNIVHKVFLAIMIIVPLILLFIGVFDLAKAATEKDESNVKKAQQALVKKAIAGALVFLVPFIIGVLMTTLSRNEYEPCFRAIVYGETPKKTGGD
jgi:hypothetical protein